MYWFLLVAAALLVVGLAVIPISQWSEGVAVVKRGGRQEVYATTPGTITALEVEPGEHVHQDQVLARLSDDAERTSYEALKVDFEDKVRARMVNPNDVAAGAALSNLRIQLQQAEVALDARTIKAPKTGRLPTSASMKVRSCRQA